MLGWSAYARSFTVVSVNTAHPRCFVTDTERPRRKKKPYRYSNHSFRAGWWQDTNTKPVCEMYESSVRDVARFTVGILYQRDGTGPLIHLRYFSPSVQQHLQ
jgi:hypothetical protein